MVAWTETGAWVRWRQEGTIFTLPLDVYVELINRSRDSADFHWAVQQWLGREAKRAAAAGAGS